jgi:hypothetical protein
MKAFQRFTLVALFVAASAAAAAAQPPKDVPYASHHCTTLTGFGGVAWSSSDPGAVGGAGIGWGMTPWFGLEGTASWLDRPADETGFAAALDAHFKLPEWDRAVPFAKAGFGLYHATFDGPDGSMPMFYRRRMSMSSETMASHRSFTDPAVVLGGGVNLFLTRRVSLRPDFEAIIAMGDSDSNVVSVVTLQLAFHFEEHPVTPSRR